MAEPSFNLGAAIKARLDDKQVCWRCGMPVEPDTVCPYSPCGSKVDPQGNALAVTDRGNHG